ncbi:MAG TPA: NAD(P)-dependent oxidoreductase [Gammaproteobacteria bacterium]
MKERVLILGGSSQLTPLLLARLGADTEIVVTTTSEGRLQDRSNVTEVGYPREAPEELAEKLRGNWTAAISLVPVSVLPRLLTALESASIGRLVALSTASVQTKVDSRSAAERDFLQAVKTGENAFHGFIEKTGTPGVLLRPAMTYGGGDNNVDFIRRMAQRFGFFPVVRNSGMRQPVHVADVADAVMSALKNSRATGNTYFLGGGERLTFEAMAKRILRAELGHERVLPVPGPVLAFTLGTLARLPRLSFLDPEMAHRMREDHVFDNEPAHRDLDFSPRGFLQ